MLKLKSTDNVGGPGAYGRNNTQAYNAWNYAQCAEDFGDGEDTKTKLSLHHKSHCSQPPNLGSVSNYKR